MALCIPDSIPSSASGGEKRLFKLLRDELPDDFFIYYEAAVNGFYPDFIVFGPAFGLLILEVKGWSAQQVVRADGQFFEVEADGSIERCQSPLRQARGYRDGLLNRLKGYPILCRDDGDYKGKLAFPVGVGAVMTGMTEARAREAHLYPLLERPQVAYKDEVLGWGDLGERALIKRLEAMFSVRFPFYGLEDDQVSTVRGVIHPEAKVREEPARPTSVPEGRPVPADATIIKTLDCQQEQLARSLNPGHRLFCGVAGSGKTLILLSRAKTLAGGASDRRVLVLCFNIALAAHLRSLVDGDGNPDYRERIRVAHFHGWARSVLGGLPNPTHYGDNDAYDEALGDRLLGALRQIPPEQKWDAVLVDEAHTFHPKWFECCTAAMKDPVDGDLLIVSDRSQSLYDRKQFTWKSVGIKARGRVRRLTRNYRNTEEILRAAWEMVGSLSEADEDDDDETFPLVAPEAALRRGPKPALHLADDRTAEIEGAIAVVRQLVGSGYPPEDIAVIYRYLADREQRPFQLLTRGLEESGLDVYWVNRDKHNYSNRHPGVRLITAKSALGLEFKAAVIPWVQQFGVGDGAEGRRELYVAMTRARDVLHLFGSGPFDFLRELEGCGKFAIASPSAVA